MNPKIELELFTGYIVTGNEVEEINELLKQLSPKKTPLLSETGFMRRIEEVRTVVRNAAIVIARDGNSEDKIIGMATLVCMQQLTGFFGRIEDVVVHEDYGGQGIGTKLINYLIAIAKKESMSHIDLTSSPERETANHLYPKLGFKRRETNVYRLALGRQ